MNKKENIEHEAIQYLENLGYKVITEKQISGSLSRPDLIAIKNKEALIIETKSEEEASSDSCLYTYSSDNIGEWRKHCKNNYSRNIAIWMVHIGGQIKSQNQRIGNKKGFWHIKGIELEKYNTVPSLICPSFYREPIKNALSNLHITDYQLIELSDKILLVKLTNKKHLNEVNIFNIDLNLN